MSECFSNYFVKNGNFLSKNHFSDSEIKSGKSIYEVLRVIDGVPLFLEKHLERFKNSCSLIGREMLINGSEINEYIRKLISFESKLNGNIKIVFNYGENENTFYFYFLKHSYPTEEMYVNGVETILYHGERENPNAKVINTNFREKVEAAIKEKDAYEAILVDKDGNITEGSKSNIFMVYEGEVITSPVEAVLPGVTRDIIISLVKAANIPMKEEKFHFKNVEKLDGLFISGTSPKVLPIRTVDNINFDSAKNEVVLKIKQIFDAEIEKYIVKKKD